MKIIQILPSYAYGDAIGNDTLAIRKILSGMGLEECVYTQAVDEKMPQDGVHIIQEEWVEPDEDDIIIYHMAVAWKYLHYVLDAGCRKIAIYHNITPASFYEDYSSLAYGACAYGILEVQSMKDTFDYCLADSEFNRQDLISYGYTCPIDVLPILIPFSDYQAKPGHAVISRYQRSEGANLVFVGRVVPNKKHEDLLAAFSLYQKYYDKNAKLFLVGSYNKADPYYIRLKEYEKKLGVQNVVFTGHISFRDILAYYTIADVFLCMSEHEGFCVPLVEAMLFETPVIAYDSCAVGGTLGNGGILFEKKDFLEVAGLIDRVVRDKSLQEKILAGQKEQLKKFEYEKVKEQFIQYLRSFLEKKA